MSKSTYLGDGAFASLDDSGEIVITAGHHLRHQATDVVVIDTLSVQQLVRFLKANGVLIHD